MRNARSWLWGLLPLLVLWWVAAKTLAPVIDTDLTKRANDAIAASGQGWAKVEIEGRDALIGATAPTAGAKAKVVALVQAIAGVRLVSAEGDVNPARSPYLWRADHAPEGLTITGYAPDDATRQTILAEAAKVFPKAKPAAKLEIADGAPSGFAGYTAYALTQLGRLAAGDASLSDTTLTISGRAADPQSYAAFVEALKALPKGLTLGSANIIPPNVTPYVWSIEKGAGGVAIGGYAPDRQTRDANAAAARGVFAGATVTDNQTLATGQPGSYTRAVASAMEIVAKLDEGKGTLSDDQLSITGKTNSAEAFAAVKKALADLGAAGVKVSDTLIAPSAPNAAEPKADKAAAPVVVKTPDAAQAVQDCGKRVQDAVKGRSVYFETSMRYLRDDSQPLIAAIAEALRGCGKVAVSIEGHADSDGGDPYNQTLSEKRATEVVSALTKAGVPEAALSAKGYGESRPVAPNSTADNKAKNRRVEFIIR